MFNPQPTVSRIALGSHAGLLHEAIVVDDFLLEPSALVALAQQHRDAFAPASTNAFPGPELPLSDTVMARWTELLLLHVRHALRVRRVRQAHGRLSIATLQPAQLGPIQRLCHRDRLDTGEGEMPVACVGYLFEDAALGGTAFYKPRQSTLETDALMRRVATLDQDSLSAELGVPPAYMTRQNRWFDQVAVVAARFNRAVFYRGDVFHTSHIEHPERLSADAAVGRLTMNGFFVCRQTAS